MTTLDDRAKQFQRYQETSPFGGDMVANSQGTWVRFDDAMAKIEALASQPALAEKGARIAALEAELIQSRNFWSDELTASRAECEGLRAALEPFAEAWDVAVHHEDIVRHLSMGQLGELAAHEVSGVHFRNARAALSQKETGDAT